MVLLIVSLLTGYSYSQCYIDTGCTGSAIQAADRKECCIGTNDGLSYHEGGTCTQCVVHGFVQATYDVDEGNRLDTTFKPNVKGMTRLSLLVSGTITAEPGCTAVQSDFEEIIPVTVRNRADIREFTRSDTVSGVQ
jgi:hypothetical protein